MFGVLEKFPSICVYVHHKCVSMPRAELSLVRLADSPLLDPFTEWPAADVLGIFKIQFPKDSLNFLFKVIILHFQQHHKHPGLNIAGVCVCWPAARPREAADLSALLSAAKMLSVVEGAKSPRKCTIIKLQGGVCQKGAKADFGLLPSLQREGFQACVFPVGLSTPKCALELQCELSQPGQLPLGRNPTEKQRLWGSGQPNEQQKPVQGCKQPYGIC